MTSFTQAEQDWLDEKEPERVSLEWLMGVELVVPPVSRRPMTGRHGLGSVVLGEVRFPLGTFTGFNESRPGKGERDRVKPPRSYRDRSKTGKLRDHRRFAQGMRLVRERVAFPERIDDGSCFVPSRRGTDAAEEARIRPESFGPSGQYDSESHGSADGRHAVCEACSVRRERPVVGSECTCTQPSRYATFNGQMFDRLTGELVVLEKATREVGGDWREPGTGDRIRGRFYVGTGEYL